MTTSTTSDYMADAAAAAELLTTRWFTADTPSQWVPDDYWKTPTIAEELVTHMRLAGNQDLLGIIDATDDAGQGWLTTCAYLDDLTCWGRMAVAAHAWLAAAGSGDAGAYLQTATTVGDNLQQQWDDVCGGGLYWQRDGGAGNPKASNSTLGLMEIALGLGAATHDRARVAWGERCWRWIESKGLVASDGLVWGGLRQPPDCGIDPANAPVIALQGNPLKPLWQLYEVTGDASLLDRCMAIVDTTLSRFTWPGTTIFMTPSDAEWASQDDQWRNDNLNPAMFKGICAGFFGEFAANLATVAGRGADAARCAAALRANADALKASYPGGVYGTDWHTPDPSYRGDADDTINAVLQYSALAMFDAAAAVAGID